MRVSERRARDGHCRPFSMVSPKMCVLLGSWDISKATPPISCSSFCDLGRNRIVRGWRFNEPVRSSGQMQSTCTEQEKPGRGTDLDGSMSVSRPLTVWRSEEAGYQVLSRAAVSDVFAVGQSFILHSEHLLQRWRPKLRTLHFRPPSLLAFYALS